MYLCACFLNLRTNSVVIKSWERNFLTSARKLLVSFFYRERVPSVNRLGVPTRVLHTFASILGVVFCGDKHLNAERFSNVLWLWYLVRKISTVLHELKQQEFGNHAFIIILGAEFILRQLGIINKTSLPQNLEEYFAFVFQPTLNSIRYHFVSINLQFFCNFLRFFSVSFIRPIQPPTNVAAAEASFMIFSTSLFLEKSTVLWVILSENGILSFFAIFLIDFSSFFINSEWLVVGLPVFFTTFHQ